MRGFVLECRRGADLSVYTLKVGFFALVTCGVLSSATHWYPLEWFALVALATMMGGVSCWRLFDTAHLATMTEQPRMRHFLTCFWPFTMVLWYYSEVLDWVWASPLFCLCALLSIIDVFVSPPPPPYT